MEAEAILSGAYKWEGAQGAKLPKHGDFQTNKPTFFHKTRFLDLLNFFQLWSLIWTFWALTAPSIKVVK